MDQVMQMTNLAEPKRKAVLVARIWHESNGFNPQITGPDSFELMNGSHFLNSARHSGSTAGGIISRLEEFDVDVIASISATAAPSGLVEHRFFLALRDTLLNDVVANRPDAIALELHGAMGTTETADAEGLLLSELRTLVGPDVPIAIGLDLHAHVTARMIEAADICIACKENPHSDVIECGQKVVDCLLAVLDGRLKPATTMAKVPMILPGAGETASGPLLDIHRAARACAAAEPDIWDISIFNVFRYSDDYDMGQAIVVTTNGEGDAVRQAKMLAETFWIRRHEFVDELLSIDQALEKVATDRPARPYVLADMGDRILAGAPGDSTAILAIALSRYGNLRGTVSLTDPQSVAWARNVGIGATIDVSIGGRITPGFKPLPVRGLVKYLGDGDCILSGPFQGGEPHSMGQTAVLEVNGRLLVLLTTRAAFSHDPAVFASQGIELAEQDFVVVKSGYHFKLNFADFGDPLLVRTPGVGYYEKGFFRYERARFWPEHDEASIPMKTSVRRGSAQVNRMREAS